MMYLQLMVVVLGGAVAVGDGGEVLMQREEGQVGAQRWEEELVVGLVLRMQHCPTGMFSLLDSGWKRLLFWGENNYGGLETKGRIDNPGQAKSRCLGPKLSSYQLQCPTHFPCHYPVDALPCFNPGGMAAHHGGAGGKPKGAHH